jgi:Na+/melibiose symporter-like transporter
VWVDRLRRRPLLIWADAGRALTLGSIPVAALLGALHIEQLYVVALLVSVLSVVFDVAYRSFLPSLISRAELMEGNSKLQASAAAAEAAGFGVAGVLVQALSAPLAILVDAASFVVSACSLALIRTAERGPSPTDATAEAGAEVWRELGEGLQLLLSNPLQRTIVATTGIFHLFQDLFGVVVMLFFVRELHLPVALMGPLFAIGGVSALYGATVAERAVRAFGLGRTMVGSLVVSIGAALCIPLAGGGPWLVVGLLAVQQVLGDAPLTVYEISQVSLLQATTPQRLQGRVNAGIHVVEGGAAVAGLLIGGVLGQTIGLRPTLLVGCAGMLLAAGRLAFSPVRTLRAYPAPVLEPAIAAASS